MIRAESLPIRALEARFYTDPAIFEKEQDGLLASTWQFAGHASLLEKTGDYFTLEVAGQNLFCIRDKDNGIRTFYNVCQHRAHELLRNEGNARTIVCPYHAWTYGLDGQLRAGPNTHVVPGFDKSGICLTSVRTEVFLGFVFVNLDPQSPPMDEWFPDVRDEVSEFVNDIDQLRPVRTVEVVEQCNWKVSVENYSECYHCQLNHKAFSTGIIKPGTYDIQAQGYCLRHTTQCQNLESMSYAIDPDTNAKAGEYSSWFLWPAFSFQVYPGNILNTYQWRPRSVDRVEVRRGWYTHHGEPSTVIDDLATQDRETTVEEDIHLVESVQRGLNSRGYRPGPLVIDPNSGINSEHSVRELQKWMRAGINDH